jgi:4-amino-4-deoxychorismate lyase
MQINFPTNDEIIGQRNKLLKASLKQKKSGLLKMIITRGIGGRGYKFEKNMSPTIIFLSLQKPKIEKKFFKSGVTVKICKTHLSKNTNLFGFKHLNRLDSVLARSEWEDEKIFEGVFVDSKQNILEGTMTNIFFVKKKTLITPPIIDSGINGVMRQVVIDNAKLFFDKVIIKNINLSDVKKFDQMFLTNSVLKVMPVSRFEKKKFIKKKNVTNLINFFNCQNDLQKTERLNLI